MPTHRPAGHSPTKTANRGVPPFSSTNSTPARIIYRVRTCVLFNPAARGEKARHFRRHLDAIASQGALKATTIPGDARRLAAEAVADGFELIVAAGGDGTVNEVLNGIGDAADGFARARLGVLPLGTVNVFAREIGLSLRIERAWETLQRGRETRLDLPCADFSVNGARRRQYFVQLAGAGLDARAIELVNWPLKKKFGPLAYIIAGARALRGPLPRMTARIDGQNATGELILVGNGRYYGGPFEVFPRADFRDGLLEVCVLPRANLWNLLRCAPGLLARRRLPANSVQRFRTSRFELAGDSPAAFELDGEWAGNLPAAFSVAREQLRVVVP
jgi:diacylglycerol kinase (ATP)